MLYTPEIMIVRNDDNPEWEIFINERNELFIGLEYARSMHSPHLTVSKEEWEVLKNFIDNQFKKDGNA